MVTMKKRHHASLDQALFAFITRRWDANKISKYEDTLRHRDQMLSAEATIHLPQSTLKPLAS